MNVVAWDKARRPGGRLTTHRRPGDGAAVQKVDLGGQYISVSGDYRDLHAGHYEALVKDGLLKSLNGKAPPAQDREEIGDRMVAAQAGYSEKTSRPVRPSRAKVSALTLPRCPSCPLTHLITTEPATAAKWFSVSIVSFTSFDFTIGEKSALSVDCESE